MDMKKLIWSEIPHQTFNVLHLTNIFLGKQVANFFQAFCLLLWPNVKIHLQSFTGQKHRHFIFFYIWITDVWKFSIIWNIPVTFKVLQLTNMIFGNYLSTYFLELTYFLKLWNFLSMRNFIPSLPYLNTFNLFQLVLQAPKVKSNYHISSYSFRGNYSFLALALCTVTFDLST